MTRPPKDTMTRTHEETTFWLLTQLHLARRIRDQARAASNRDLEARRAMQHELQLAEGRVVMMQLRAEEAERRLAEHRRNTFADVPERLAAREALPLAERDAQVAKAEEIFRSAGAGACGATSNFFPARLLVCQLAQGHEGNHCCKLADSDLTWRWSSPPFGGADELKDETERLHQLLDQAVAERKTAVEQLAEIEATLAAMFGNALAPELRSDIPLMLGLLRPTYQMNADLCAENDLLRTQVADLKTAPAHTHVPAPRAPTPVPNPAPGRAAAYLLGWILWHPDGSAAELVSLGIYSDDEISLTYNHAKGFYVRLMSATGDDYADAAAKITTYLAAGPLSRLLPKLKGYTPPAPPSTLETR